MSIHNAATTADVFGTKYQIRRFTPAVGCYIWQRLMLAIATAQQQNSTEMDQAAHAAEHAPSKAAEVSDADRLRAMCGVAYMYLSFTDMEFIQKQCMRVVSRMELLSDKEMPMPLTTDAGVWAIQEIADDPMLVTRLMTEVLAYNLAPFLASRKS